VVRLRAFFRPSRRRWPGDDDVAVAVGGRGDDDRLDQALALDRGDHLVVGDRLAARVGRVRRMFLTSSAGSNVVVVVDMR
jgi:hypothetical protein